MNVATDQDTELARAAVLLIMQRGFNRGRGLEAALVQLLG